MAKIQVSDYRVSIQVYALPPLPHHPPKLVIYALFIKYFLNTYDVGGTVLRTRNQKRKENKTPFGWSLHSSGKEILNRPLNKQDNDREW